jgi:outer membrane protein assembly factor BamD (BamD/ComL family)
MRWLALVAALLLAPSTAQAQYPNEQRARSIFFSARTDFKARRYRQAVAKLDRVTRLLGARKRRVLPMLIRSLYQIHDYVRAAEELRYYFRMSPSPLLAEYQDMARLRSRNASRARTQRYDFERARGPNLRPYRDYLQRYPYSRWARIVATRLARQKRLNEARRDRQAFDQARRTNTIRGYQRYLSRYPRGRYRQGANEAIANLRHLAHQARMARLAAERRRRAAERRATRARYLRYAGQDDRRARGHTAKGILQTMGGLVLAGGGVAIWVTGALGKAGSSIVGGLSLGMGVSLMFMHDHFRRARSARRSARRNRRKARSLSVVPIVDPRGNVGVAASVSWR